MRTLLRTFGFSGIATLSTALLVLYYLGPATLLPLFILIIIEVTFSFDNAVINAKILRKLSPFWQKMFLSVGIIIAIFGMRLLFPILIVALSAGLGGGQVLTLALHHPQQYAAKLAHAQPAITAFGGAFLLMLCLQFFMAPDKKHHWWHHAERLMQRAGVFWWLPSALSVSVVTLLAALPANHHGSQTLQAGLIGVGAYLCIHGLTVLIGTTTGNTKRMAQFTGGLAFVMFLYLQVLDASLSLDGVLGAFAITNDVILIMAGLGVGAVWVRSLTVYMVRRGTLDSYTYLEHGAYYAIAVLAFSMLLAAVYIVPDVLTGSIGVLLIAASIVASIKARQRRTVVA